MIDKGKTVAWHTLESLEAMLLAAATVDRLLHHAHVIVTEGADSYRLIQATEGKGVLPLS